MDVLPALGNGEAILRIQVLTDREAKMSESGIPESVDRGAWRVTLNGRVLEAMAPGVEAYPFKTPFKAGFAAAEQYLRFAVPKYVLKDGANSIVVGKGPRLGIPTALDRYRAACRWQLTSVAERKPISSPVPPLSTSQPRR